MKKRSSRKCYLCRAGKFDRVKGRVRDLPSMPILRCGRCGLIFLANFDHVDEQFYEESKMREKEPIGSWEQYLKIKECSVDDKRRADWVKSTFTGGSLLDFGCGAGGFLARAKRFVKKCSGVEKDRTLRSIIEKRFKIKVYSDIEEVNERFDIITLFHVLEHVKDPKGLLIMLSKLLNRNGRIVIEVPNSNDALLSLYESKEFSKFIYWKCHLYMFNEVTLGRVIRAAGLSPDFISQFQRYPISNHLYWLAKGRPGGHKIWDFIDSGELNDIYAARLAKIKACDTLIASAGRAHG